MLIECHSYEAIVDAIEFCKNDTESQFMFDLTVGLFKCPSYSATLVGVVEDEDSYKPKAERFRRLSQRINFMNLSPYKFKNLLKMLSVALMPKCIQRPQSCAGKLLNI